MSAKTSEYGLPYPTDTDMVNTLPDILQAQAEAIETVLNGFDFNGQDTTGLAARVTAAETKVAQLQTDVAELQKTKITGSNVVNTATNSNGIVLVNLSKPSGYSLVSMQVSQGPNNGVSNAIYWRPVIWSFENDNSVAQIRFVDTRSDAYAGQQAVSFNWMAVWAKNE